jgi:hypothetical protein
MLCCLWKESSSTGVNAMRAAFVRGLDSEMCDMAAQQHERRLHCFAAAARPFSSLNWELAAQPLLPNRRREHGILDIER